MAFEKNKLSRTLVKDAIFSLFIFTIITLSLSPFLFVNAAEASHRTTPIVSTRNHFWPYGILNWWHTPTDYAASDIPGCSQEREIVIHVHGWGLNEEQSIYLNFGFSSSLKLSNPFLKIDINIVYL